MAVLFSRVFFWKVITKMKRCEKVVGNSFKSNKKWQINERPQRKIQGGCRLIFSKPQLIVSNTCRTLFVLADEGFQPLQEATIPLGT